MGPGLDSISPDSLSRRMPIVAVINKRLQCTEGEAPLSSRVRPHARLLAGRRVFRLPMVTLHCSRSIGIAETSLVKQLPAGTVALLLIKGGIGRAVQHPRTWVGLY